MYENKEHKSLHQEALNILQTEKPVELTQIDRKVGNRIIVQTFFISVYPYLCKSVDPFKLHK